MHQFYSRIFEVLLCSFTAKSFQFNLLLHDSIKMIQLAARHSLLCRKFRGKFKRRRGAGQSDFVGAEGRDRRQMTEGRRQKAGFEIGFDWVCFFAPPAG